MIPPLYSLYAFARWLKNLEYFRDLEDEKIVRTIYRLEKAGLLKYEYNKVDLTPDGYKTIKNYEFDALKLKRMEKWDGVWRMVVWDVPENQRTIRDTIRYKLKAMNFARIQRSIWITPWPCRDEVIFLKNKFNLKAELIYIEAGYIEGERELRNYFGL